MINKTMISKDLSANKILVTRDFSAPVEKVWKAWTDSSLLDKWWAPKPWKAETKEMNFNEGGYWLYAMVGPDGTKAWCRVNYLSIAAEQNFKAKNGFSDENGVFNDSFPFMNWFTQFSSEGNDTKVMVEITFDKPEDLRKIVEMGFEQGFSMGLDNLEELLTGK